VVYMYATVHPYVVYDSKCDGFFFSHVSFFTIQDAEVHSLLIVDSVRTLCKKVSYV
jgi:hypothetical protein